MKTTLSVAGFALAIIAAAPASAATELVVNGGFEQTTNGIGQLGYNTDATGWTTSGYNFLFSGNTADTLGANGQYDNLKLWGPGNGANNGLGGSPTGGNYLAADGAYLVGPISQVINGLVAGQSYTVSFDWAAAQQKGYDGLNTEQWEVSLGDAPSQSTDVYHNSNHGFSGWMHESFTFTADSSTETLSFLAHGTPAGVPPFSLLDNVSLQSVTAAPEPASWALMIVGFGGIGAAMRRRGAVVRHAA